MMSRTNNAVSVLLMTTMTIVVVLSVANVASGSFSATRVLPIPGFLELSKRQKEHMQHAKCKDGHQCPLAGGMCCKGGEVCCPKFHPCDHSGTEVKCHHSAEGQLLKMTLAHVDKLTKNYERHDKEAIARMAKAEAYRAAMDKKEQQAFEKDQAEAKARHDKMMANIGH